MTRVTRVEHPSPMPLMPLSPRQFVLYLEGRRAKGEHLQSIGASFGVSRQAVHQWLHGAEPSLTVLILAGMLAGGGDRGTCPGW